MLKKLESIMLLWIMFPEAKERAINSVGRVIGFIMACFGLKINRRGFESCIARQLPSLHLTALTVKRTRVDLHYRLLVGIFGCALP